MFLSQIKERYRLNQPGSDKETYHIVLDLSGSGLVYEVGDCVAIQPSNCLSQVDTLLKELGATGTEEVQDRKGNTHTLRTFLTHHANLDRLDRNSLKAPPLLPRYYSIASSMGTVGDEAHLTVQCIGTCSDFLCHRIPLHTPAIPLAIHKARTFILSDAASSKPIIMIGPGTGIAPFRGFMQKRTQSHTSKQNWLFFGERNRQTDFYYQEFWEELESSGHLKLDTAFSRDQEERIYVQDKMAASGPELWQWLQKGAYLYVCGDASKMAKDVDQTLLKIAQTAGHLSPEEAKNYFKSLRKEGRYLRDVY